MARCPFAVQKILPENASQGRITPRAIILHTAVDSVTANSSIYPYFVRADVSSESHFYVLDNGTIEQYIDTEVRADANVSANGFAISIETEDDGNPAQRAWTPAQMDALARLITWLCNQHGIPRKKMESTTGSGIGWHSMWGINTATSKPNPWTTATGKTCPGGPRINQMPQLIGGGGGFVVSVWDEQVTSAGNPNYHTSAGAWLTTNAAKLEWLMAHMTALEGTLGDDEAKIIAAVRNIVADDQDTEIVVGPGHIDAIIAGIVAALPASVTKEDVEASVRRVFQDAGES
jgi:hypothetical protein